METKIPNTIEKLIDKQKKTKYISRRLLMKIFILVGCIILVTVIVIAGLAIGGVFNG